MGQIRAFFAVEIKDKKLIHAISKLQEKLVRSIDRLKLVELENLHITLRFLGDISEQAAKRLYFFLETEVNPQFFQNGPIEFTVQKLNDFSKRVFHLGLQGPVSVLREIHDRIDEELIKFYGFEQDRKFKTHITLARARRSKTKRPTTSFPLNEYHSLKNEYNSNMVLGRFKVAKVYLKKSVLTPQGPIYSNLEF
jgi:2'-5' RNA ligase